MTDAEARKILAGDKSFAMFRLRHLGLEDHQHVLRLELARRKPRKLLTHLLRNKINSWTAPNPSAAVKNAASTSPSVSLPAPSPSSIMTSSSSA